MQFPDFFLWLTSGFITLWSEKMHGMNLIFLYLLSLVVWRNMWSVLENVPWALENNVYSAALGWNVLNISVKSIWSSVSLKAIVSLLIFCLYDLAIDVSGVLRSPAVIVLLSVSSFKFIFNCCIYLGAPNLGALIFTLLILLVR